MNNFDWGWVGVIFLFLWIIFIVSISGCQTLPKTIDVQLLNTEKEINKVLSNDECILYAFKIEGWNYNWVGGYLASYHKRYPYYKNNLLGFFWYLKTEISLNEFYWHYQLPKIKANYLYLKEYGYFNEKIP